MYDVKLKKKKVYFFCIQPGHTHENTKRHTHTHELIFFLRGKKHIYMIYLFIFSQTGSFCVSLISSRPIQPSLSPTPTPAAFSGAGRGWGWGEAQVDPPPDRGLRHQLVAASRPRHGATHTDGGHMDCGRRQPSRAEGQGQGSGRRAAPTGAGPLLKAVRSPDDPRRGTSREDEGRHGGGGILICCLCGTDTAGGRRKSA